MDPVETGSRRGASTPLDADRFAHVVDLLVADDGDLAAVVAAAGRPSYWSRPPTFATLVLLVLEQQVSLASGKAVFDRLRERVGEVVPDAVAVQTHETLRSVGMTRQKAGYVADLAVGIRDATIDWRAIVAGPPELARPALLGIRGIGPWTTDVWLLACRGMPDEWPVGDRALQVGCAEVVGHPEPLVGADLAEVGHRWAPHRSTAARLVWHAYLARRDRVETVVDGLDADPGTSTV